MTMTFKNLKKYCEREYKWLKFGGDPQKATDRCYGAMMFFNSCCKDLDLVIKTTTWWENEILPKFQKLY